MPESMQLLKCPACGGPLAPPTGESTMSCPYCKSSVVVPESLRMQKKTASAPQTDIFSGIDTNAMVGFGTQWGEVVQLAQNGNKAEAVKKYMALTGNNESSATYTVDHLARSQFVQSNTQSVQQMYAPMMAQANETVKSVTRMSMWIGCGITAFVMFIILITMLPVLIGVFASLTTLFK